MTTDWRLIRDRMTDEQIEAATGVFAQMNAQPTIERRIQSSVFMLFGCMLGELKARRQIENDPEAKIEDPDIDRLRWICEATGNAWDKDKMLGTFRELVPKLIASRAFFAAQLHKAVCRATDFENLFEAIRVEREQMKAERDQIKAAAALHRSRSGHATESELLELDELREAKAAREKAEKDADHTLALLESQAETLLRDASPESLATLADRVPDLLESLRVMISHLRTTRAELEQARAERDRALDGHLERFVDVSTFEAVQRERDQLLAEQAEVRRHLETNVFALRTARAELERANAERETLERQVAIAVEALTGIVRGQPDVACGVRANRALAAIRGESPSQGAVRCVRWDGRDQRQQQITDWARKAFGEEEATNLRQRGIRLLEEAIEAYQACCGVSGRDTHDERKAHELVRYVFERPAGNVGQELGGVAVTALALAAAAGLSADEEECREINRVLSKPIAHFTQRNAKKNAAGFLVVSPKHPGCAIDGHMFGGAERCARCDAPNPGKVVALTIGPPEVVAVSSALPRAQAVAYRPERIASSPPAPRKPGDPPCWCLRGADCDGSHEVPISPVVENVSPAWKGKRLSYLQHDGKRVGVFEVRLWPNKHPDQVRRLFGWADQAVIGGWHVVLDMGGGVDKEWSWGHGLMWLHPDPEFQIPIHGTFDQILTPVDDAARAIIATVKENQRT